MPVARRSRLIPLLLTAALPAACGDPVNLNPPSTPNVVDTVQLHALRGTAVALPSGFDVPTRSATRTDAPDFDFAFDISDAGAALVYPAGALGLSPDPGLLRVSDTFEGVETAPTEGYVSSSALELAVNDVFVARSRPAAVGCTFTGALPRYGKFRVLAVDAVARSVMLEALVNQNCGYRDLLPGLPDA
jgi:hypothetical protein